MAERIQRVLVVVAHPDDADSHAGGTVAKLVREGKHVVYSILTNGDKGSTARTITPERLGAIRQKEQRHAARVLGVETVEFLGFPDCELEDTWQSRLAVTALIRRHRPDLVITQSPHRTPNLGLSHRDHRITGSLALDCIYPFASNRRCFPELLAQGLEPHVVKKVYLITTAPGSWSISPRRST